MSVGSNIIRGTIRPGMIVVPVFRFNSGTSTVYGFYRRRGTDYCVSLTDELMKFDGGGICAASVEFDKGHVKMKIAETLNIATDPKIQNFTNLTVASNHLEPSTTSIGSFSVNAIGMSGDGHNLYAGVWYRPTFGGNDITVTVWQPTVMNPGFPGAPDSTTETNVENSKTDLPCAISFIPFTRDVSVWHQGICSDAPAQQFALQRFTSWVRSRYMGGNPIFDTMGCNSTVLGASSKNCIFIGTNCNMGIGYDYCMPYETCGKCFGKTENGGHCLQNLFTKRFYPEQIIAKKEVIYDPTKSVVTTSSVTTDSVVTIVPVETLDPVDEVPQTVDPAGKNLGGDAPLTGTTRSTKKNVLWVYLVVLAVVLIIAGLFFFYHHKK